MKKRLGWEYYFELAKVYYEKNGNLKIPKSYKVKIGEDVINLGMWIHEQRKSYNKCRLSKERIRLLESIGMIWYAHDSKWEDNYKLALEYYRKNGNLKISADLIIKLKNGEKVDLGTWITHQRQLYKEGKLSEDRIKLLESIGMKWSIQLEWEQYFKLAKAYYSQYGNLVIPRSYSIEIHGDVINLGKWINTQRIKYKNGNLSEDRIALLENIGMKWSVLNVPRENNLRVIWDEEWKKNYQLAKAYYNQYGNLEVSRRYKVTKEDGRLFGLGNWISTQRQLYKSGRLSEDMIRLLEDICMRWEIRIRKPIEDNKFLCEEFGLDCEKYPDLLKISYEILSAKINYLNSNNIPLINGNELNPIFFMSDVNMQVVYGISLEDLVKEYSSSNKKGGK